MRDEVELPLVDRIGPELSAAHDDDALATIERFLLAVMATTVFVSGLVRIWLLDRDRHLIGSDLTSLVRAHVASRRRSGNPGESSAAP